MSHVVCAAIQSGDISLKEKKKQQQTSIFSLSAKYVKGTFLEENTRQCKCNYESSVIFKWNDILH